MAWWFRSRRRFRLVAALAAYAVFILLLADFDLPWPGLVQSGSADVPIVLLLPLAVIAAAGDGLATGETPIERASTRPVALMDALLAFGMAAAASVIAATLCVTLHFQLSESSARNLFGLTGLFLLARSLLGSQPATAVPATYAAVAMLIGRKQGDAVEHWAWVISREAELESWAWAVFLVAAGLMASFYPIRKPPIA